MFSSTISFKKRGKSPIYSFLLKRVHYFNLSDLPKLKKVEKGPWHGLAFKKKRYLESESNFQFLTLQNMDDPWLLDFKFLFNLS